MNAAVKSMKRTAWSLVPAPGRRWWSRRRENARFRDKLRANDVFLIGHPKSGNTWLAYMLAVTFNNDRDGAITLANVGSYVPTIHGGDHDVWRFEHLPSPRIFRNEAPRLPECYPRTIYIIRDPRAVLVSYYHHCVHDTGQTDWPIDVFLDEMLMYGCIKRLEPLLIRWDRQVLDWLERARRQPVHFVKYEELKADSFSALRKIAEFLNVPVPQEQIQLAVTRGEFGNMRKQEETCGAESFPGERGSKGYFVRKGAVDGWREELSDAQASRICSEFSAAMGTLGYR